LPFELDLPARMPVYVVEFESEHGPERRPFTLDDDRPLQGQLSQILVELSQAGQTLAGGPGDVLAATWHGADVDLRRPPAAQGLTPQRPIVLQMRPKPAVEEPVPPPPPTADWCEVAIPPVDGALGALVSWAIAAWWATDVQTPFRTSDHMDIAVTVLLVLGIAVAVIVGAVQRDHTTWRRAAPVLLLVPLAGAATLLGITLVGASPNPAQFVVGRVVAWASGLAILAVTVTSALPAVAPGRHLRAMLLAGGGGIIAALVISLPGPSVLVQAFAFMLAGAATGYASISSPLWRAQHTALGS